MLARGIVLLVILAAAFLVSCSQAAPSAPAGSGGPPAAAPSTQPASKPAASQAAKPAASPDWKDEWDKTVAAAKKEGKVTVAGAPGDLYRRAVAAFEKAYPDIQFEYTGIGGSSFAPKILAEREAGQHLWDVHIGGAQTAVLTLKPKGVFDPLKPALLLPEIVDGSKWLGGFSGVFLDKEQQYVFNFEGRLSYVSQVNRDMVSEAELSAIDQLVDPKWKGKIAMPDPRQPGAVGEAMSHLLVLKGEEFLRKLFAQDIVIQPETRPLIEGLVRGRYPIAMGLDNAEVHQFRTEGLAGNIKPIAPGSLEGAALTSGFGSVMLINKAPNPNAAKVFINWLLSRDGQKAYVDTTSMNSRRLDVEGPMETAPKPNVQYKYINTEELLPNKQRVRDIAKEIFK